MRYALIDNYGVAQRTGIKLVPNTVSAPAGWRWVEDTKPEYDAELQDILTDVLSPEASALTYTIVNKPDLEYKTALATRTVKLVQNYMDGMARSLGYDDIKSAVTYAEEPSVVKFQNEGRAFRQWRSLVWAYCYEKLAEVQAGAPMPTLEVFMAGLPTLQVGIV